MDQPGHGLTTLGAGGQLGVGIIRSLTVNRQNPSELLANSNAGGLFSSIDKGLHWSNAGSDGWFRSGASSATFAPDNQTTWYAASNQGGSYYDGDAYIGSVGGLYRTLNAGASWSIIADRTTFNSSNPIVGEATIIRKLLIDPKHSNIGFMATNVGLYKSDNINGATVSWYPPVHPGLVEDLQYTTDTSATSTLVIAYVVGGVWDIAQSTDQGVTWASLPGQPSHVGTTQIVLAVSDASPSEVYVLDRKGTAGIYVYNVSTGLWSTRAQGIPAAVGMGHCFGVSNFNSNQLYVGAGTSLFKSTDGGQTLGVVNVATYHNDVEYVLTPFATCATCSHEVYLSTHGGVNYSADEMSTLQSRSFGLGVAKITGGFDAQTDPAKIIIGVDHDGTILSGGTYGAGPLSWKTVLDGDGGQAVIDYTNANNVWAEYQYPLHFFSSVGGDAYTYQQTVFPLTNSGGVMAQNLTYADTVYSNASASVGVNEYEDLFRAGAHGLGSPLGVSERVSDFATYFSIEAGRYLWGIFPTPSDPNVMYISEDEPIGWTSRFFRNRLMMSAASVVKANWQELPLPVLHSRGAVAASLSNPNILYFGYSGNSYTFPQLYVVDYTSCTTVTCTPVAINIAGSPGSGGLPLTALISISPERGSNGGIYVGTDVGVYYTNAGLINWTNPSASQWVVLGTNLPHIPVGGMEVNYAVNKLRVYTSGRGVWEHDLTCPSSLSLGFSGGPQAVGFHEAVNEITTSVGVAAGGGVTDRAGTYVELDPGFSASPGAVDFFSAFVHPCTYPGNSPLP